MVSSKFQNMFFGSVVLLTAVTGTLAMPKLAANPAVLFVAAQFQMATGHTSAGLSLINRLVQGAPSEAPSTKPSPAKQEMNCKMNPRPEAVRIVPAKYIVQVTAPKAIPVTVPLAHIPAFERVSQPIGFYPVDAKMISGDTTRRMIDRQVRKMQEQIQRSMIQQKLMREVELRAALSGLQQSQAMALPANASVRVQFNRAVAN